MIKQVVITLGVVLACVLQSCLPSDVAVTPFDRGNVVMQTVTMGSNYENMIYYNLRTNTVVQTQPVNTWHFAVQSNSSAEHYIRINSGMFMSVKNAGKVSFEGLTTDIIKDSVYDTSNGDLDSTAIGMWWNEDGTSKKEVYIINLGMSALGRGLGKRKVQFISASATNVTLKIALLNNDSTRTITIEKDPQRSWVGVLLTGATPRVLHEPRSTDWDIVFTRYTYIFHEPTGVLPYSVTGVLLNDPRTQALLKITDTVENVTAAIIDTVPFSTRRDIIGYDWKYYDLDKGVFTTYPRFVYVIKDGEGFLHRLNFLDFYSADGVKGAPTFAVQRL